MSITFEQAALHAEQQATKPDPLAWREWPDEVRSKNPVIEERYRGRLAGGRGVRGRIYTDRGVNFTSSQYYGCRPVQPRVDAGDVVVVLDQADAQHAVKVISWEGDHIVYQWGALTRKARIWVALHGDEVDKAPHVLTGVNVRHATTALEAKRREWEDRLGRMADDEDWCGEFESVMERAGLEPRRVSMYDVDVRMRFEMSATDVDDYLNTRHGGRHDTSESFDLYSDVTLTGVHKSDVDAENVNRYLRDEGYDGWTDYEITDSNPQEGN